MGKLIILVGLSLGVCCLLSYAIRELIKEFLGFVNSNKIFASTAFVIILGTLTTYFVALLCRDIKELGNFQVGSADAWIGFAGSCLGGFMTMLAVYFTLIDNRKNNYEEKINSIKPYLSCRIVNLDPEQQEILVENYIESYGFVECEMRNISNNIANGITIKDQHISILCDDSYKRIDDLLSLYGISIYTVSLNDGTFLAPQEKYRWRVNLGIEVDEEGKYKWDGSAVSFVYTINFQYEDISRLATYSHRFQFEININVDVDNKLHFFLWNIGNSVELTENK